jgi:hypothetical protein
MKQFSVKQCCIQYNIQYHRYLSPHERSLKPPANARVPDVLAHVGPIPLGPHVHEARVCISRGGRPPYTGYRVELQLQLSRAAPSLFRLAIIRVATL